MVAEGKTIGILVARMSSSRLPGKVLKPLAGKPLLKYTLERLQAVTALDEIWLATTADASDAPLVAWAEAQGIPVLAHTGDIDDVVGRLTQVVTAAQAHRFVAVLGDTPFVDSRLLRHLLSALDANPDWESVVVDETPGPTVHSGILCFTRSGWARVEEASQLPAHREHAGSILREQSSLVTRGTMVDEALYYTGPYRLTVDTQADFDLAARLIAELTTRNQALTLENIIKYLQANPTLATVNRHVRQKTVKEKSMKVLMAIQAGGHYGLGHLSRCKTIARALQESFSAGVTIWLDTPTPDLRNVLASEGWTLSPAGLTLPDVLHATPYDRVVIDFQEPLQRTTMTALLNASPTAALVVVDNNGLGCALADAVIYPNAHATADRSWHEGHARVFGGPEYVLLGANFLAEPLPPPDLKGDVPFVLVSMGGVDPHQLTEHTLNALNSLEETHLDLVVPPHYPAPEKLEAFATSLPSTITLHWRLTSIRPLMQRATVAIAAFGVTVYELAYMGVPTLMVAHHEGQLQDMERFAAHGSAISLGLGETLHPARIYESLKALLANPQQCQEMAEKGRLLVPDTKGAYRVAECIAQTARTLQTVTSHS